MNVSEVASIKLIPEITIREYLLAQGITVRPGYSVYNTLISLINLRPTIIPFLPPPLRDWVYRVKSFDIPYEIFLRIVAGLTDSEIMRWGRVNKRFHSWVTDPTLWKDLLSLVNDSNIETLVDNLYYLRRRYRQAINQPPRALIFLYPGDTSAKLIPGPGIIDVRGQNILTTTELIVLGKKNKITRHPLRSPITFRPDRLTDAHLYTDTFQRPSYVDEDNRHFAWWQTTHPCQVPSEVWHMEREYRETGDLKFVYKLQLFRTEPDRSRVSYTFREELPEPIIPGYMLLRHQLVNYRYERDPATDRVVITYDSPLFDKVKLLRDYDEDGTYVILQTDGHVIVITMKDESLTVLLTSWRECPYINKTTIIVDLPPVVDLMFPNQPKALGWLVGITADHSVIEIDFTSFYTKYNNAEYIAARRAQLPTSALHGMIVGIDSDDWANDYYIYLDLNGQIIDPQGYLASWDPIDRAKFTNNYQIDELRADRYSFLRPNKLAILLA